MQYGLGAFNDGVISFEQFLDLNARAGGHDIDGNVVPERTVADPKALRAAYATGRLNNGGNGLGEIPIIDVRPYTDGTPDVHDSIHMSIMRARLVAANGHADNRITRTLAPGTSINAAQARVLDTMDAWLENIASDDGPAASPLGKVVRNKPAGAVDACYTASLQEITDPATCRAMFPMGLNPRLVAGEPLTMDRLKCALKPVDPADYAQPLTAGQLAQIAAVFPEGVCDYSLKGIGQRAPETWLAYPREGHPVRLDRGR